MELFVDLSVESIAVRIEELYKNEDLRKKLINNNEESKIIVMIMN